MIAGLPMYDRAETCAATDQFWNLIRDHLRQDGIDAPDGLSRDIPLWDLWQANELLLAQTCGFPYRARLHEHVTLIGTPNYDLPGCPPGHYNSVIVAHKNDDREFPEFEGACLAINDPMSQSGWTAPQMMAQSCGFQFDVTFETGSHLGSATAVLQGDADLAAIDAQTWRLMAKWDDISGLQEIIRTPPTPGLPLITAQESSAQQIRNAVRNAIAVLDSESRAALSLHGLIDIPKAEYFLKNVS